MADFYPLLDRAIRGLPDNTREARNALFTRARDVLVAQLRGMDPPLGDDEIAHELAALDEVIARVESEQAPAPVPAAQPATPPVSQPVTPNPAVRPSVGPATGSGAGATDAAPAPTPAPTTQGSADASGNPGARPATQLGHSGIRPAHVAADAGAGAAAATAAAAAAASAGAGNKPAETSRPSQPEADPEETRLRPPSARAKGAKGSGNGSGKRNALIGGLLAVALVGVAGVAYWANKVKVPTAQQADSPEASVADPGNEQKFGQRVDAGQAKTQAGSAQPSQVIAGSQRAILYEETPDNPQTPKVLQGRVTWKLDSENPGQNLPLENIVRADVAIPEAGLELQITLRRNTDAALPASHLMELTFRKSAAGEGRVIRDIGVPQFKTEENARGVPLAGLPVAVSDTVFLVGLSNLPNDVERNIDLIRNRPWIDLPVRYDNGRRAVIALEKGASGDKVLSEAFGSWGAGN